MEKVFSHIRRKMQNGCPMCGGRNWSVDNTVHFLGIVDPEYKQPVEGQIYPVISVSCGACLFTYHLPAVMLGVF